MPPHCFCFILTLFLYTVHERSVSSPLMFKFGIVRTVGNLDVLGLLLSPFANG